MKTFLLTLLFIICVTSCNTKKGNKAPSYGKPTISKTNNLKVDAVSLGKQLFSTKTCVTCHHIDKKNIGPSIKDISAVYKEKNKSIVSFLKGELNPIVDTIPSQVAIMKININSFTKKMSLDELKALETYIHSI